MAAHACGLTLEQQTHIHGIWLLNLLDNYAQIKLLKTNSHNYEIQI